MTAIAPADHAVYLDWLRAQLDQAIIPLDDAAWDKAAAHDSIDSYRAYLAEFPSGRHSGDANEVSCRLEADRAAWIKAKTAGRIADFDAYLAVQPTGKYRDEARQLIDQIIHTDETEWQKAKKRNSFTAYRNYLKNFPEGLHRADAYERAWRIAAKRHSISGYQEYLSNLEAFPDVSYQADAVQAINILLETDAAAWRDAVTQRSRQAYDAYLTDQPEGRYRDQAVTEIAAIKAVEAIEDAVWQRVRSANTLQEYAAYLYGYPRGRYRDDATQARGQRLHEMQEAYRSRAHQPGVLQRLGRELIGRPIRTIRDARTTCTLPKYSVAFVAMDTTGRYAFSVDKGNMLGVWNLEAGELIRKIAIETEYLNTWLATVPGNTAGPSALSSWTKMEHRYENAGQGKWTLSSEKSFLFRLLNLEFGETIRIFRGHTSSVTCCAISPDGLHCLTGSDDKTLRLWDLESGETIRIFEGHSYAIKSVAITPDGHYALSGADREPFRLWSIETGETLRVFEKQHCSWDSDSSVLAITADGNQALFVEPGGKAIRLWDLETGRTVRTFKSDHGLFTVTPDGLYLLATTRHGTLRVWDLKTGDNVATLNLWGGITAVTVSSDGCFVLSGSSDGTIQLWELRKHLEGQSDGRYGGTAIVTVGLDHGTGHAAS